MYSAIWWIRRDLRLSDNPSLTAAMEQGRPVIPLFILDPVLLAAPAEIRKAFLFSGLSSLDRSLRKKGSRLIVRSGKPKDVLPRIIQEGNSQFVYAEEDYSPYARNRDAEIAARLPLCLQAGVTVHHPSIVVKPDGKPYTVFTPFSKVWNSLPVSVVSLKAPEWLPGMPALNSDPIPESEEPADFPAGEEAAIHRLDKFVDIAIFDYQQGRNILGHPGTSCLSPYLRFGMISARTAMNRAKEAMLKAENTEGRLGCQTWMRELVWREFYNAILYHFPDVLNSAFRPSLRNIPWQTGTRLAGSLGRKATTGYPVRWMQPCASCGQPDGCTIGPG